MAVMVYHTVTEFLSQHTTEIAILLSRTVLLPDMVEGGTSGVHMQI